MESACESGDVTIILRGWANNLSALYTVAAKRMKVESRDN
jgi:hypothetical protein